MSVRDDFLAGRPMAPKGADWDATLARWKKLPTDEGATYDRTISIDADTLEPVGLPHSEGAAGAPAWTALDQHQCSHCPLAPSTAARI